jgi:threonine synthase
MDYVSTRGSAPRLGFADTLLAGLATDGGLYVPESYPALGDLTALADLDYAELATEVMWPYVAGDIERGDFESIVREAYGTFDAPEVCPVTELGDLRILELFHGPTLAFKDVALQLVGRLFELVLEQRDSRVTILGATSGDTGSAAMDAFRGLPRADCVILFPDGRVSEVQRRQMTTITESNCHAVAVTGTFDDCQDLVKAAFGDEDLRTSVNLSAVNSINWGRVMAQIVYYVWAHLRTSPDGSPVSFCVPTGNFGNILAGWVAKQMGLPVDRLIVASNRNDILTRFFNSGTMEITEVIPTTSPSMDIQVSSNLERLLFEALGRDGARVAQLLSDFRSDGTVSIPTETLDWLRRDFDASRLDDTAVGGVIGRTHSEYGVLLDPHTAVGVGVAQDLGPSKSPMVCLATAHPAKFPDAVFDATGVRPPLPAHLADLFDRTERLDHAGNSPGEIAGFVRRVFARGGDGG